MEHACLLGATMCGHGVIMASQSAFTTCLEGSTYVTDTLYSQTKDSGIVHISKLGSQAANSLSSEIFRWRAA